MSSEALSKNVRLVSFSTSSTEHRYLAQFSSSTVVSLGIMTAIKPGPRVVLMCDPGKTFGQFLVGIEPRLAGSVAQVLLRQMPADPVRGALLIVVRQGKVRLFHQVIFFLSRVFFGLARVPH